MPVNVIGNALTSHLVKPVESKADGPVLREHVFGLPVDRGILFTDEDNRYRPAIEMRQRKWIVKLLFLRPFLLAGERVLRITSARSPVRWYEQLLTAGAFLGLERAFLVFTGYRILHIPTDSAYRYRQSIAQVRYRDIRRIRLRGGTLAIDYKSGRSERFGGIPFRERKKIRQLLTAWPMEKEVRHAVGRRHLCPRCRAVLSARGLRCRRCDLAFKSKSMAGLLALLFPGGGYFYVRQFYPAAVFFALETLVLAQLAASGTVHLPLETDRTMLIAGLTSLLAALKAAGWLHARHFLAQYIPRHARLGRWTPPAMATLQEG